jgi:hypothetical protein
MVAGYNKSAGRLFYKERLTILQNHPLSPEWMSRKLKSNENPTAENNLPFPYTAFHFPDPPGPCGNCRFILSATTPGETGGH